LQLPSSANPIGFRFIELQSVDSTNKYAMSLIHEGMAQHGLAVFAGEQTEGKGQRGKSWLSEKANNIILSIIINPFTFSISEQFKLSICAAVSVLEFFSHYAGDETKIKWPNDLYWRDRKAGGLLIENVITGGTVDKGKWKWAIVGIGININQSVFPEKLFNPVSLKQITGKNFEPKKLAIQLCSVIEKNYTLLSEGKFTSLFSTYQNHLYKKNEIVRLKKGNRVFETRITGVTETGQLITKHSTEERFEFGEISWEM